MVIAAVAIAVLLAFAALVLNLGFYLVERRALQNAADAGSLAAAVQILSESQSRAFRDVPVYDALLTTVRHNGVDPIADRQLVGSYVDSSGNVLGQIGAGGQFSASAVGAQVTLSGPLVTLLPAFSVESIMVSAEAQARLSPVAYQPTERSMVPLAAPMSAFEASPSYDLYNPLIGRSGPDSDPKIAGVLPMEAIGFVPFVDLADPINGGVGYIAAVVYGFDHTNFQYWSDGSHDNGRLGIGNLVGVALPLYFSDVRTGLFDNVVRQGLIDADGEPYALITVVLTDSVGFGLGVLDSMEVAGFASFKIRRRDISETSLPGYFVPYVPDPPLRTRRDGPVWGPVVPALVR